MSCWEREMLLRVASMLMDAIAHRNAGRVYQARDMCGMAGRRLFEYGYFGLANACERAR